MASADLPVIQGKRAGSQEEARFAYALEKLRVRFQYQVPVLQPRGRRGGYVVDFVCYVPFATPVEIFGGYWHRMDSDDRMKLAILRRLFKREVVVVWDTDLETNEEAVEAARKYLRL